MHRLKGPPTNPVWYSLLVLFVVIIGMAGFNVWYTNHVQETADQRWCELFGILNPPAAPPSTKRGREIAALVDEMRRDFQCPPR
jgi:uncharacterized iron-regulated membrane protein